MKRAGRDDIRRDLTHVVAHLRLPLQLTLAPLYLWGVFGAGGGWSAATVGAFVAVHAFLYGGTTLYNSYYDRDEGPIAGMERPVPLPPWALPFSLAWQGVGLLIAAVIGAPLAVFYAAYAVMGALYSHPRPRLKGRPYVSTGLIFVFQGMGGVLAGWLASGRPLASLSGERFPLMALVAACTTIGLYPLTQIYQVDEDAARGDRTLAMALGPRRSFLFALVMFAVAAAAGLRALAGMGRPLDGALLAGGYVFLGALTAAIGSRFAHQPLLVNFRRLVLLQVAGGAAFAAFVVLQFAHLF